MSGENRSNLALDDSNSIESFIRGHGADFYCGCEYLHKVPDSFQKLKKAPVKYCSVWDFRLVLTLTIRMILLGLDQEKGFSRERRRG